MTGIIFMKRTLSLSTRKSVLLFGGHYSWLNSDDLLLDNALLNISRNAIEYKKELILAGRCVKIDENENIIGVHIPLKRSWIMMAMLGHGLSQMATFWTREAYQKVGGIDSSFYFSFDYDLFIRLKKISSIKIINDYVAAFRIHPKSKTRNKLDICYSEDRRITASHLGFQLYDLFSAFRRVGIIRRIRDYYHFKKDIWPF